MIGLAQTITSHMESILRRLRIGRAHWDDLVEAIERTERRGQDCYDEQLWTFILACAYAACDEGPSILATRLTGTSVTSEAIWFEVKSRSPRVNEGQTVLDLALGNLASREGTASGIALQSRPVSNIIFCEFKWFSDLDCRVSYDQHRNQLARVVENALFCRSPKGDFADEVHVCLVTPQIFRDRASISRLYRYKWADYTRPGHDALVSDLQDCGLPLQSGLPGIRDRLPALRLAWKSYEELAFSAPPSPIRDALKLFYSGHKGSELSDWVTEPCVDRIVA